MGLLLDFEDEKDHQICGLMWADNFRLMSHSKEILEEMLQDIIGREGGVFYPKPRVCGGQVRMKLKKHRHECDYKRWFL